MQSAKADDAPVIRGIKKNPIRLLTLRSWKRRILFPLSLENCILFKELTRTGSSLRSGQYIRLRGIRSSWDSIGV